MSCPGVWLDYSCPVTAQPMMFHRALCQRECRQFHARRFALIVLAAVLLTVSAARFRESLASWVVWVWRCSHRTIRASTAVGGPESGHAVLVDGGDASAVVDESYGVYFLAGLSQG